MMKSYDGHFGITGFGLDIIPFFCVFAIDFLLSLSNKDEHNCKHGDWNIGSSIKSTGFKPNLNSQL